MLKVAMINPTAGGLSGGYRKYLRAIVPLMAADPRVVSLELFVPPAVATLWPDMGVSVHSWREGDHLFGFRHLRAQLNQLAPNIVFCPTACLLPCRSGRTVMMVRNMEPFEVRFRDVPIAEGLRNFMRAVTTRRCCHRADRVIAVSDYAGRYVRDQFHVPTEKIGVVPHGVERTADVAEDRPDGAPGGSFIFTAGSIRPARGLTELLHAMASLDSGIDVCIAGTPDTRMEAYGRTLKALCSDLGISERVHWLGHLDQRQMAWCYKKTACFVMTSRAEACPNVVLEAMANGCVVVSTTHEPMPEFLGDTAIYYTSGRPDELADKLRIALSLTHSQREERFVSARRKAWTFSWEKTARLTVDELATAADSNYDRCRT